jgi:hypothetical protein
MCRTMHQGRFGVPSLLQRFPHHHGSMQGAFTKSSHTQHDPIQSHHHMSHTLHDFSHEPPHNTHLVRHCGHIGTRCLVKRQLTHTAQGLPHICSQSLNLRKYIHTSLHKYTRVNARMKAFLSSNTHPQTRYGRLSTFVCLHACLLDTILL